VTKHEQTCDAMVQAFRQFAIHSLLVSDEDLKAAREAAASAESIGFMVDPTAYRRALQSGSLQRQRKLIALFERTRNELAQIFPDLASVLESTK
jgi:hypothetical protein